MLYNPSIIMTIT